LKRRFYKEYLIVQMSEGAANNSTKDIGARLNSEKSKDIRQSNIIAAKAVADVVRTSLGPRGMDKMI
jgi:T-complex protein 1 subunit delta